MKISNSRKIKLNKNYWPLPINEGDEIYPNGIFNFSNSRIMDDITSGKLNAEKGQINVKEWFKSHIRGSVNEEHLSKVDIERPVLQAEIRPGMFEIIDGNHRMKRAYRSGVEVIESYILKGEQLLPYFADVRGYKAFIEYWNSKL